MTPERYQQIGDLYHAALEIDAVERAAFLERECSADEDLRREVESLIASHEQSADFIATRSEEHTSELQSRLHLVCRLLLEKKKKTKMRISIRSICYYSKAL